MAVDLGRFHNMGYLSRVGAALLRLCAVVGPMLLGLLAILYTARPSIYFLAAGVALVIAILASDAWIIAHGHWLTGGLALATQTGFLFLIGGYTASPFPAPSALSEPLPQAAPPAGMAIYLLPTGVNHRTAAFAYRGGSPWERWDSALDAVLVRHPQGDLLIDAGVGRTITSQLDGMPSLFRLATDLVQSRPAADRLAAAG